MNKDEEIKITTGRKIERLKTALPRFALLPFKIMPSQV
jgi:hypothetical protein